MNVPLSWLAEFVPLPKSETDLCDRLTMIGHMLDKINKVDGETIIDLELRGNRPDLFGIIGIARDIYAAFGGKLTLPETTKLPKTDPKSTLISCNIPQLVDRIAGLSLSVHVDKSPDWLIKKLAHYGIASINNVVDITNYVMVETGEPLHAFDLKKLKGKKLIVRTAKKDEPFTTFQKTKLHLTPEDIVLADEDIPQGTALIGSNRSEVDSTTQEILLEAAVYKQSNIRRTSRKHAIRTEASTRHEKHLDPNQVIFALERAVYLLQRIAHAKPTSATCDFYPNQRKPIQITLTLEEIQKIAGITIPFTTVVRILESLGCKVTVANEFLYTSVPTFRTDIVEQADLIEEVLRIYGYDKIPTTTLSGQTPTIQTPSELIKIDKVKDVLVGLQINEVITNTFVPNSWVSLYNHQIKTVLPITILNAPDQTISTMRPSLLPNLVAYAKRSFSFRQKRLAFFEIGNIYQSTGQDKRKIYSEELMLGIVLAGEITTLSWNKEFRELTFFDLKGIVESLFEQLGIPIIYKQEQKHDSFDTFSQSALYYANTYIGSFGKLSSSIAQTLGISFPLYLVHISLKNLLSVSHENVQPYQLAPLFPPIIEDLSFVVPNQIQVGAMLSAFKQTNSLISDVVLLDSYKNCRTFTVTYQMLDRTLTDEEIRPIRNELIQKANKLFGAKLKEKNS